MRQVLVTGGHKRLGRAIALELGAAGFAVAVHYRRDPQAAADVVAAVAAGGGRAVALQAELTDPAALTALVAAAAAALGGLSLVVAAAASYEATPVSALDGAQLERAFACNARAAVELVLAARPWLAASGDGRFIALGDLAAQTPYAGYLAHSMAKAALHAAVKGLAVELAPAVTVNAIVPGAVLRPAALPAAAWERLLAAAPQGRLIADDPAAGARAVAEAARYLATCSRSVNGTFLTIDGGRTARW